MGGEFRRFVIRPHIKGISAPFDIEDSNNGYGADAHAGPSPFQAQWMTGSTHPGPRCTYPGLCSAAPLGGLEIRAESTTGTSPVWRNSGKSERKNRVLNGPGCCERARLNCIPLAEPKRK